jgi:hypothetical protein
MATSVVPITWNSINTVVSVQFSSLNESKLIAYTQEKQRSSKEWFIIIILFPSNEN